MKIRNLRTKTNRIHANLYQLTALKAKNSVNRYSDNDISQVLGKVTQLIKSVDTLCRKQFATPADLATPSFRIFLWMRFISHRENLKHHILALHDFMHLISKQNQGVNLENVFLKIDFSGYLYRRKTSNGKTHIQINESLINAPSSIQSSVISATFSKRRNKHLDIVRTYASSPEIQHMNKLISGYPIANRITCKGKKYDLSILFNTINDVYFGNQLTQPRLIWSSRNSKRRLGYFHPEIHTIAVNQKLDHKEIPRLVVEYVLYHEMLHQYYGIKNLNGRRYAHTTIFKKAEKNFRNHKEAENLIKHLQ